MADVHGVDLTSGPPETVLPPLDPEVAAAVAAAEAVVDVSERRVAMSRVAAHHPRCLEAWASLAELTDDDVERYAFARVGYHRGLDALRGSGWRGSGTVRWRYPENRGFLRSLDALRRAAAAIGETDEEVRCSQFLGMLDPGHRPGVDAS
jgi:hypothetical protein